MECEPGLRLEGRVRPPGTRRDLEAVQRHLRVPPARRAFLSAGKDDVGKTKKILCVHGGISSELVTLDEIREIERPIPVVLDAGPVWP